MKMELEIKLIKKSRGILEEDISENKLDKKEDESESELEKKIGILNAKIDFITVSKTTKILTLIFYIILPIILLKLELSIEKILSIVLFISLIFFIIFFIKFKLNIKLKETEAKLKYLNLDKSELSSTQEEEFFKRLVEINFKYLDQYYLQTKEQADKSFMLVVIAGTIGLVIITLGIGLVYKKEETVGNIVTITGILIEFITAIFFYLYNKTLLKTGDYHKKLVLSQNVSLALKTTEDFDINEKFKLREKIILEITKDINQHLCK